MVRDTHESPATRTANSSSLCFLPFSPLERVLLIQETIGMIMDELSPRALLNLGMSCRALYEPAMDRLWRTLPSLGRLLLCLPEELVEAVTARQVGHTLLRIKQVPEPHQWERVRHHSHRVRVVVSPGRDVTITSLRVIKMHYPEPVLFPNLRECRLQGLACSREMDLFLQPSLLALRYDIYPECPGEWHLDRIARNAPNLEVLDLIEFDRSWRVAPEGPHVFWDPDMCKALSDAILCFGNLTAVGFATFFHLEAIMHLSRLPRLARLHIYLGDDNCTPLGPESGGILPFRSLRTLHINGKCLLQLTLWLQPLQLPSLTTIRVSTRASASVPTIQGLFRVLTQFGGLTSLELLFSNAKLLVNAETFDPLLQRLPRLEEFILNGLPFNPTRDFLAAMASAWPRLRNLELGQSCYLKRSPCHISFCDLLIIAHYCAAIERIAIPLSPHMATNPTSREHGSVLVTQVDPPAPPSHNPLLSPIFPDPATPTSLRISVSKLREIRVTGGFVTGDHQRTAEFLANVFPEAKLTFRCPPRRKDAVEVCIANIMDLKRECLRII